MRNVNLNAVSIGGLVDVTGTFGSALVVTAVGAPAVLATNFVLGMLWSLVGGYLAAWSAGREEVLHGALSSYFCVGLGVYGLFAGHGAVPRWMHVLGYVVCPGLGALGGYLRSRQASRIRTTSA
jgi:hypothetical protein